MLSEAGSGHPGGALGLADLYACLYFSILNHDPKNPDWSDRDILAVSNGHTAPVLYSALAESGYFDRDELLSLRKFGSRLQGHPERKSIAGVETTSGPLGSGLGQASGMAYYLKNLALKNSRYIYVVMGDGEMDEGNVWESVMFGANYNLDNLIVFVDRNYIQIDGNTEDVMKLGDLSDKWRSFGWHTQDIDGNDIRLILNSVSLAKNIKNQPKVIVCHNKPGKGVDFMEDDYRWHGKAPDMEQTQRALKQLEEK